MEFYLVDNFAAKLPQEGTAMSYDGNIVTRDLPLEIKIKSMQGSAMNEFYCERFKHIVEMGVNYLTDDTKKTLPSSSGNTTKLNWTVRFILGLNGAGSWNVSYRDFVQVIGVESENVLIAMENAAQSLNCTFRMRVEITDWTFANVVNRIEYHSIEFMNCSGSIQEFASNVEKNEGCRLLYGSGMYGSYCRINSGHTYKFNLSIIGILDNRPPVTISIFEPDHCVATPNSLQKILEDERQADATLIAANGVKVSCHRFVLNAQSAEFQNLFNTSTPAEINMPNTSEAGVRALLDYLYTFNTTKPEEDYKLAMELLDASRTYKLRRLEKEMIQLILVKPESWIQLEDALKLFLFARDQDGYAEVKMKALKILKTNFDALEKLQSYDRVFEDNKVAAKEICRFFVKYQH